MYGKALLEHAIKQSSVLGGATEMRSELEETAAIAAGASSSASAAATCEFLLVFFLFLLLFFSRGGRTITLQNKKGKGTTELTNNTLNVH